VKKIIIAIDGLSSTGKSTLAKQIAKQLNYIYVDSGAMYRAVALYALQKKLIIGEEFNKLKMIEALPSVKVSFVYNKKLNISDVYLNDVKVNKAIRSMEVSNVVSVVAAIPQVRQQLVKLQQQMGIQKGVVMDGRDIGSVVFPNADLKLYMTANAGTRAKRRYDELLTSNMNLSLQEVLDNINLRDHLDSTRKDSPLLKSNDAIEFDNSQLSKEQQLEQIMELVNSCLDS
jgi:cytidylate kinase